MATPPTCQVNVSTKTVLCALDSRKFFGKVGSQWASEVRVFFKNIQVKLWYCIT